MYSGQETVIILHLSRVYGLDVYKAGIAFIAAVAPTLISLPLTGYFSDNKGAEWVAFLSLLFGIPWWGLITLKSGLARFLAVFAFESEIPSFRSLCVSNRCVVALFTSGLVSPLMTELAAVSRSIEGVGCEHTFVRPSSQADPAASRCARLRKFQPCLRRWLVLSCWNHDIPLMTPTR